MSDTLVNPPTKRRVHWWQHVLGLGFGSLAVYALSYSTALWVSFTLGFSSGGPSLVAQPITLALTAASAGAIVGVVQSRLLIRAGFIAAMAVLLLVGLLAAAFSTTPMPWGTTTPLAIHHFLVNIGTHPGTVGVLVAGLIQALMIRVKRDKNAVP